jgi:hypothetical protein
MFRPPSPEQAAIAAVAATADLLGEGGWPNFDTNAHRLLHETDIGTVALLAGLLVHQLGSPARDALRQFAIGAAAQVTS